MKRFVLAAAIGAAALLIGLPAGAQTVDAPNAIVAGQSIADWTAAWWTRFWQIPASAVDLGTGSLAPNVDNNGPVYFAPITSGDPSLGHVTFNISVPYGVPVLVPVIMLDDLESVGIDGPFSVTQREQAADATINGWKNSVNTASLFATVDGNTVPNVANHLEQTGYFDMGIAEPNTNGTVNWGETPNDDMFPSKAAGYWLMIEDFSLGQHTLTYGGSSNVYTPGPNCCTNFPIGPFAVDVTTNIDVVVPEPTSGLLILTGLGGLFAARRRLSPTSSWRAR